VSATPTPTATPADYSIYISPIVSGVIIAIVTAVLTQVIAYHFAKKSLAMQCENNLKLTKMQNENSQHLMEMQNTNSLNLTKMQNENSLKLTALELYHQDRKEAILKLDVILKKGFKNYPDFEKELKEYLDSSSGLFLPQALRQSLKQETDEIDKLVNELDLETHGDPPEYDDSDEWFEELEPWERLDQQIKDKLRTIRPTLRERIRKYISGE
jgi:hypothetical protein